MTTTTTPRLDDLVTAHVLAEAEARFMSALGYEQTANLAHAEAESIRDQINALCGGPTSTEPIPCSCPTKVQIPVGAISVCLDGVTHHGPDECGPCGVES